jgi:DNA-binding response OmpR family regulator
VGSTRTKILIVEDDAPSAQAIGEGLELEGFEVRRAGDAAAAIESVQRFTPDVVLVDLQLPLIDGREFIEVYRRSVRPAASVIVMSGRPDGRAIAKTVGADAFVPKPIEFDSLLRTISLTLALA